MPTQLWTNCSFFFKCLPYIELYFNVMKRLSDQRQCYALNIKYWWWCCRKRMKKRVWMVGSATGFINSHIDKHKTHHESYSKVFFLTAVVADAKKCSITHSSNTDLIFRLPTTTKNLNSLINATKLKRFASANRARNVIKNETLNVMCIE